MEEKPETRALLVLALAGADALPALVEAAEDEKRSLAREAAYNALRHWAGTNPRRVEDALGKPYLRLMRLYLPSEFAPPDKLAKLLDSDRLALRQAAHYRLQEVLGVQVKYDAAATPARRAAGRKEWDKILNPAPGRPGG